jgi:alkaline phosphatase D
VKQIGPIVGHVTRTTARIWVRAESVAELQYRTGVGEWTSVPVLRRPELGGNVVTDLAGLHPATEYQYRFLDRGAELPGASGRFSTFSENPSSFSFAFGSCHDPFGPGAPEGGYERWSALADAMWSHDFLLLCGDQIYEHGLWPPPATAKEALSRWEAQYERFWGDPRFAQVTAFSPTYTTWDDHEIRDDWGSRSADWTGDTERLAFAAANEAYQRFQNAHNPPGYGGSRHYGFRIGSAAFYVLDLRGDRGKDPEYPVLGKQQFQALLDWLSDEAQGADLLFLVSPVPVAHVAQWAVGQARLRNLHLDIDTADLWNDPKNQKDLRRLLDTLFHLQCEGSVRQVFILGGDVHVATASRIQSENPQHAKKPTIYQFTSSPLATAPPGWAGSLFSGLFIRGTIPLIDGYKAVNTRYLARRNFGEVKVRRQGEGWAVEFSIAAEGGGILNPWARVEC